MRILQVAPLVAPIDERDQIGGAQVLVAELARGLVRAGHDVTLAAADGSFVHGTRLAPLGIDARTLRPAPLAARAGPREDDAAQRAAFQQVRQWLDAHPKLGRPFCSHGSSLRIRLGESIVASCDDNELPHVLSQFATINNTRISR